MQTITLHISGLHADALATHLLLVLNNYVSGKKAGSIPEKQLSLLKQLDQAYQKLNTLTSAQDDETPQPLQLALPEAEALLQAFTQPAFKEAALQDDYYQRHSYADYLHQIYAPYLREVGASYVEALAS